MSNAAISQEQMAPDALVGTVMQSLHCMMTLEVTQAQPFQWVMEPLLPSAGSTV